MTLAGHTGRVTSVAFSPDGTRITSGSGDNTIRVAESPTCMVHFRDGWLHLGTDKPYLWIPHSFRRHAVHWAPSTMVISARPRISLQFNNAALGPDWAMMKI
ncbi:hypothetical protein B0H14DRAFT_2857549 [Mycena olivaceomarginata]|nr:hypothetical protein B0H14DRAFT_2857549 [Mycena olivaceomarginata]